jgi:cell division protein FtsZ
MRGGSDMIFMTAGLGSGLARHRADHWASRLNWSFDDRGRHPSGSKGVVGHSGRTGLEGSEAALIAITTLTSGPKSITKASPFTDAFGLADGVLRQAVRGISDIVTLPGLINVDFADVRAIMESKGVALMGTGQACGENRALEAVQRAISSPLLEEASIQGAKALLVMDRQSDGLWRSARP